MTVQVQVSIPYWTNIPADVVTNTWYFDSLNDQPVNDARAALVFANLESVYEDIYGAVATGQMAPWLRPLLTVMKMYDLDDPQPRTAVRESVVPLTVSFAASAFTAPETAIVASYHTEYESGINKQSQRGRVYLGGLSDTFFTTGAGSSTPVVKLASRENIGVTLAGLQALSLADDWGWVVYSPTLQQSFAVAGGWIDDALDTQRRRGTAPSARYIWTD